LAAMMAAPFVWIALYWINTPLLDPAWVLLAPLIFLTLVIVQPILEEVVFRGLLQSWLLKKAWASSHILGITAANVMISIIFSGLHFIYSIS